MIGLDEPFAVRLHHGSIVSVDIDDVRQVLEAFGLWDRRFHEDTQPILNAVAEAQNLFGGKTFVPLGKAFAELPELFNAFRAALALDTPAETLQHLLIQGLL